MNSYKYFNYSTLILMLVDLDDQISSLEKLNIQENKILIKKLITIIENIIKIIKKYYTFETVTKEGKQFKKILKKYGKNNQ